MGVHAHLDDRPVGPGDHRGGRPLPLGEEVDERFVRVGRLPGCADLRGIPRQGCGDRGEDAPGHRDEHRLEGDPGLGRPRAAEVLLDLGDVTVRPPDGVGCGAPQRLGRLEVRLGSLARAGVADGERGDDVARVHETHPGLEREGDGRDVAAGNGHRSRRGEDLPLHARPLLPRVEEFRQSVRPGPRVGGAVEGLPVGGLGEPEVRPAVEDQRTVQCGGHRAGGAVRQREHHDVRVGEDVRRRREDLPPGEGTKVGVVRSERGPGTGGRGEGADGDLGMAEEEPQHLPARVAGRSGDGNGERHVDEHTEPCIYDPNRVTVTSGTIGSCAPSSPGNPAVPRSSPGRRSRLPHPDPANCWSGSTPPASTSSTPTSGRACTRCGSPTSPARRAPGRWWSAARTSPSPSATGWHGPPRPAAMPSTCSSPLPAPSPCRTGSTSTRPPLSPCRG